VFATIAAAIDPDALAGSPGEPLHHRGRDRLLPYTLGQRLGAVGVGLGLIAYDLQASDALFQCGVFQIGDSGLDGIIEPL
jgi:hypothetical protein